MNQSESDTSRNQRPWRVGIFGTFDVQNYGDLLFPIIAHIELSKRLGAVEVIAFSYDAKSLQEWPYEVVSLTELPRRAHELDAILIGGGFIIRFDKFVAPGYGPTEDWIQHPTGYWLTPALIGAQLGIPVIWNAPGMHCNDLPAWSHPLLSLALQNSAYIAVRDEPTQKALDQFVDDDRVRHVPDTAFALGRYLPSHPATEQARQLRAQLGLKKPYIVIQVTQNLGKLTDHLKRFRSELTDVCVLLLRIGPVLHDHESFIDSELTGTYRLPDWPSPPVIAALISESEGVAGHSYHLAITALCAGVPVFTSSNLSIGKFTALSRFSTVYPLSTLDSDDPRWLADRIGRKDPSALIAEAEGQLEAHWSHVVDAIEARRSAPNPAMNAFWMSLPSLLERDPDETEQGLGADAVQKGAGSEAHTHVSRAEAIALRQTIVQLEQELKISKEVIASRDTGIAWLKSEVGAIKLTLEQRRKSIRYLLVDALMLLADRSPLARRLGNWLLPSRFKNQLHSESLKNQLAGQLHAFQKRQTGDQSLFPGVSNGKMDIVCLANIEWSARYQRPQHMMSQFAAQGHRVFYIARSIAPAQGEPYVMKQVAPNVYEIGLGFHTSEDFYARTMSQDNLLAAQASFSRLAVEAKIREALVVVHLAYWTTWAIELQKHRSWRLQYDCMDEWADFPDIGQPLIEEEETLVQQADLVTVTASLLEEKWKPKNANCVLVRNGVEFEFFSSNCVNNELLAHLKKPVIGFYGALAPWVDFSLLHYLATRRPDWNFVLVGDCFVKDLAGIDRLPNVHLTGRKPYEDMPRYLYGFDVCLIPFKLNKVTHAVDPVKFYEFISVGKPVVSVPLQEMAIYADYVYFATEYEDFLSKVEAALTEDDPDLTNRRIQLAKANDWHHRYLANDQALQALYAKCSIVVISYNNADLTRQCIESIVERTTYPNYELIVVDNASQDGTRDMLRALQRQIRNLKLIINDTNRGFAAANNQGIAQAEGEYVVLLNNDTVVTNDWLEALLRHLKNQQIGLVGPVTNSIGNEAKIAVDYSDLRDMHEFAARHTVENAGRHFDISVLAMFCVAMRREVFNEIGALDEAFGVGMFEDDDYCRRLHSAGYRTVCAEDSFVHHYGQASFKKLIDSGEYQAIWDRNQAYFESKWGAWTPHTHTRNETRSS